MIRSAVQTPIDSLTHLTGFALQYGCVAFDSNLSLYIAESPPDNLDINLLRWPDVYVMKDFALNVDPVLRQQTAPLLQMNCCTWHNSAAFVVPLAFSGFGLYHNLLHYMPARAFFYKSPLRDTPRANLDIFVLTSDRTDRQNAYLRLSSIVFWLLLRSLAFRGTLTAHISRMKSRLQPNMIHCYHGLLYGQEALVSKPSNARYAALPRENCRSKQLGRDNWCLSEILVDPRNVQVDAKSLVAGPERLVLQAALDVRGFRKALLLSSSNALYRSWPIVFILRRGARSIVNEDELLHFVASSSTLRNQVYFVRLETLSFERQLSLIAGASVLMGVEGAGLTWVTAMRTNSCVVHIMPDCEGCDNHDTIPIAFDDLAQAAGVRYVKAVQSIDCSRSHTHHYPAESMWRSDTWRACDVVVEPPELFRSLHRCYR